MNHTLIGAGIYLLGVVVNYLIVARTNDASDDKLPWTVTLSSWVPIVGLLLLILGIGPAMKLDEAMKERKKDSMIRSKPSYKEIHVVKKWRSWRKRGSILAGDLGIGE